MPVVTKRLGTAIGLGPGDIVLDGDPSLPSKRGTAPPVLTHVYCSQTAGWINMPLGTDVGLFPGHMVLDGDPAPAMGHSSPNFDPAVP